MTDRFAVLHCSAGCRLSWLQDPFQWEPCEDESGGIADFVEDANAAVAQDGQTRVHRSSRLEHFAIAPGFAVIGAVAEGEVVAVFGIVQVGKQERAPGMAEETGLTGWVGDGEPVIAPVTVLPSRPRALSGACFVAHGKE